MATKTKTTKTASKREANAIYRSLGPNETISVKPKRSLDGAINDIYLQAHSHRNRLVGFYIAYTIAFSLFVTGLIIYQAIVRATGENPSIELIPEYALNLLVIGMFGQFISLLTIVTTKVWTFEPFLKHHLEAKETIDEHSK